MRSRLRPASVLAASGLAVSCIALTIGGSRAEAVTQASGSTSAQAPVITAKSVTALSNPSVTSTSIPPLGPGSCASSVAVVTPSGPKSLPTNVIRSTDDSIPLYLDQWSAGCGERITIRLGAAHSAKAVVRAYRIGWYGGAGSRLVWSSAPIRIPATPMTTRSKPTISSPNWKTNITTKITSNWAPGLYAIVTSSGGRVTGVAEFVVRSSSPQSAVVVYSGLTNASYSPFGGASLYRGLDGGSLATTVALQRPLVLNGRVSFLKHDVPTAQALDRVGIRADAVMDTDVHSTPSLLTSRNLVVLPGHSEYWTKSMYDALLTAQSAGTNIAVLGANEIYWQARVQMNSLGQPVSMFVARKLAKDPLAVTTPALATVRWRDAPLRHDPSASLGESYTVTKAHGSLQILSLPGWLAATTGLRSGAILQGVAAGEVDGPRVAPSIWMPTNLQVIGLGLLRGPAGRVATAGMTYYTAPSGSAVFQFGSTNWACQLMATCPDGITSTQTRQIQWALTTSVVHNLSQRGWGRAHPSTPNAPKSISAMHSALSPAAYGTFGAGS